MKDWTPEQRAEAVRKSAETRARKAEEKRQKKGGAFVRADAKPGRRLPISIVQVRHGVSAIVVGIDAGLGYLVPTMWVTDPDPNLSDRLTEREVQILTEAFSDEAMKHPRVLRFLANLTSLTDRLGIAGALLIVALPRMARRGLIPGFLVPILRDLIGATSGSEFSEPVRDTGGSPTPTGPEVQQTEEPGPDREAA